MPEMFPLLGSLNAYSFLAASNEKLIIEGPFFTCNELNLNGWGIPESEAQGFAATFSGQPIRWCPMGKTVLDPDTGDVIAAEHYCDLINSQKTIVGKIIDVYPNGRNENGNLVYWQKAEIVDPTTVTGIIAGKIPTNVSMWAYGTEMLDDGMIRGARGMSESIVSEPAYQEARFNYQIVAASRLKGSRMGASGAYVPNDPKKFGISTKPWEKPTAASFKRAGHDWDDPDGQRFIKSCAAVVTGDGSNFGDCHLFHHVENGDVSVNGVNNAKARLSQTEGIGSIRDKVEAHLSAHQTEIKKKNGASMVLEPKKETEIQQTIVPMAASTTTPAVPPGVTINIAASEAGTTKGAGGKDGDGEEGDGHNAVCAACGAKLPIGSNFCHACGVSLHPRCAACQTAVPVGAKFCPSCGASMTPTESMGTTGDNTSQAAKAPTLQAAVAEALAKAKDEDSRRTLAASIAEVQIKTGVITEADGPKTVEALFPLSASVLETHLSSIKVMASKIEASTEHGLQSGSLPGPMVKVGAGMLPKFAHGLPPENIIKAVFQRLGAQIEGKFKQMDWDTVFKYGSLKNVPGSAKWAGTYHQDRELLPL